MQYLSKCWSSQCLQNGKTYHLLPRVKNVYAKCTLSVGDFLPPHLPMDTNIIHMMNGSLPFPSILQNTVSGQKLDGGKFWNEAKPKKLSVNFSHFAQIYDSNYMLTENCLQCKKWNPHNFYISKLLSLCQQGEKRSTMAFLQQNPTAVNPLDSPIGWHPHPPVPPFLLTK